MSISALNSALSGLRIAQSNINLISSNIANVNTEGYTRKTQQQSSLVVDNRTVGVLSQQIERAVDKFLRREVLDQIGVASGLETRSRYLQQIQEFHGPAEGEYALSNQLGKLKNAFQNLANDPGQEYLLNEVYQEAFETVDKFHKFSDLLTGLRNDAQDEMNQIVNNINSLNSQIADLNQQIKAAFSVNKPTADLEDQRDIALNQLSEYIDISYYERTDDKVLVVQTQYGTQLADELPRQLHFNPSTIGASMYYPNSVAEIRVGDPTTGVNITDQGNLGGKLGALTKLRDETLPQYQAQMDEMAYRMAERFDSQGLRLFSLSNQSIPLDDPTQDPPNGYAGFSRLMRINPAVVDDRNLIRSGTNGNVVSVGSSEVLRKIVDFTFGDTAFQQATGTVDMSGGVNAYVLGTSNIENLVTLDAHANINPGSNDTFSIQVGAGPTVNMVIGAGDTAADLVNTINGTYPGMASLDDNGRLVLTATDSITIADVNLGAGGMSALGLTAGTVNLADADTLHNELNIAGRTRIIGTTNINALATLDASDYINSGLNDTFQLTVGDFDPVNITIGAGDTAADLVNTINTAFPGLAQLSNNGSLVLTSTQAVNISDVNLGPNGLAELGITTGTTNPTNPSFTVQLGNLPAVNVEITPSDTGTTLLAKINAIDGVTATLTTPDGFLQITPDEGGDITLVDGLGNPLQALGVQVANVSHASFKSTGIGPGGTLSSGIGSATTLTNYVTQAITKQSQDASNTDSAMTSEQIYRDTLIRRAQDESGVNIDEEMAMLVQLQNNYAAAAKAIQVVEEMFAQLMATVLR